MDKRPKQDQGSSWNDENDKLTTNPNRRQEEDQRANVESPRDGQRASRPDSGSSESPPSERDEQPQLAQRKIPAASARKAIHSNGRVMSCRPSSNLFLFLCRGSRAAASARPGSCRRNRCLAQLPGAGSRGEGPL